MFRLNIEKNNIDDNNKIKEVDSIEKYGYRLEDRDTKLFKSKYEELKKVLSEDEVDFSEYATLLSELYIIDLYTISNKLTQYDVGATEYVIPDAKENFELKVRDTIYKYVIDNSNGKRVQELPEVSSINCESITEEKKTYRDETYEGYTVLLTWDYQEDLGYDKESKVSIIKKDEILYIMGQE